MPLNSESILRACPHCGAANRVPVRRLADAGRCGSCRGPLLPVAEPLEANHTSFQSVIDSATVPVFVDFWASWCGPCRSVAPEVDALAKEMAGEALVLKVDTEAQPALAEQFRVQSIPTFLVFSHGQLVVRQSGAVRRDQMKQWIKAAKVQPSTAAASATAAGA